MKKIIANHWPVITLLVLSTLIVWPLFLPGYFSHHDDLQVMRILEMRKCLSDLQIPCRWVQDMGYGYGYPLFNFYSVFPYYLGAILSLLFGFIGAVKILFFIPLVLGGIAMYILAQRMFGKIAGLSAAVLYLFAPYRALDSYVRGAVAESFALSLVPLVFYFFLQLVDRRSRKFFVGATLALAVFLTSHNIMALLFFPLLLVWIIFWFWRKGRQNISIVILSLVLGVGLAAFFIVPAYFEKSLVQTESLTTLELNFRAHFVTVKQLFLDRFWGYGASGIGAGDTISFQIGWPHWWLGVIVSLVIIIGIRKNLEKTTLTIFFILLFLFSIFMTHNKSGLIWEKISILRFVQFPWRFLSLTVFSVSLLGGIVITFFNKKMQYFILMVVVLLTVLMNWYFFRPESFDYSMTDQKKLSGSFWEIQQKAALKDFLPKTALEPREKAPLLPIISSGDAKVTQFINKSNSWEFNARVKEKAVIEVPVFDFPYWQVEVNGKTVSHFRDSYLGRISMELPVGEYQVKGRLTNTGIRTLSNITSILSVLVLVLLVTYGKNKKIFS